MNISKILLPWIVDDKILTSSTTDNSSSRKFRYSKIELVIVILVFRACYLSAMAISCHLIPDHNPGNDVLRFEMRLNDVNGCFCLSGHACDMKKHKNDDKEKCAIRSNSSLDLISDNSFVPSSLIPTSVWKFLLSPLTKWDAARFLNLAVNLSLRDPPLTTTIPALASSATSWETSEKAHAFLPLFPWTIRQFSLLLYHILPTQLLPPTFESLIVLSGLIFNNFVCLVVATMVLYDLTILVITRKEKLKTLQQKQQLLQQKQQLQQTNDHDFVATVVCLVFGIWNPAIVFFATNYSESFFATTTLLGHVCIERSNNHGIAENETSNNRPFLNRCISILWWLMGICCWMTGSYTRSNGMLHCLWLLQDGLARILLLLRNRSTKQLPKTTGTTLVFLFKTVMIGIQSVMGALFVFFPVRYHDWKGWERHCSGVEVQPSWCNHSNESLFVLNTSFSLYSHIQDKHWNIGFFRYYEWKQIPNFILAAPILVLSAMGVFRWIYSSLVTNYGRGKIPSSYKMISVGWSIHALSESVSQNGTTGDIVLSSSSQVLLVENERLLGHYAILSILTLIGLVIAHVQISTRMICSTSPAIIWFIANCLLTQSPSTCSISLKSKTSRLSQLVFLYVALYMLLGVILHVNFLPWT
mmetsp:Transcript_15026/g.16851  ORF Transcript_15026/g.16851 Transcript_15026/m.16851 type:complete len:642 (+) Transcript_15026:87-2012(+)